MTRARYRLHLSTCLLLMSLAALALGLNLYNRGSGGLRGWPIEIEERGDGPMTIYLTDHGDIKDYGARTWRISGILANLAFWLLPLFFAAWFSEAIIAARSTGPASFNRRPR
ncbi:MAG: hypothetical protein M5U26_23430 [Planctomycetota bacterium]|nr:hypothetical protein [Planctomycetota bacterium]